jgi:hypothetical protein
MCERKARFERREQELYTIYTSFSTSRTNLGHQAAGLLPVYVRAVVLRYRSTIRTCVTCLVLSLLPFLFSFLMCSTDRAAWSMDWKPHGLLLSSSVPVLKLLSIERAVAVTWDDRSPEATSWHHMRIHRTGIHEPCSSFFSFFLPWKFF